MYLQYKTFENSVRIGEVVHKEQFLLFLQFFLPFLRTFYHFDWMKLMSTIFSLAVFREKNGGIAISLMSLASLLASCKNFDILKYLCYFWRYLPTWNLEYVFTVPKRNPCYQGRQFKMYFFFFQNYAPFSTYNFLTFSNISGITFYSILSTTQLNVGTRIRCSCLKFGSLKFVDWERVNKWSIVFFSRCWFAIGCQHVCSVVYKNIVEVG